MCDIGSPFSSGTLDALAWEKSDTGSDTGMGRRRAKGRGRYEGVRKRSEGGGESTGYLCCLWVVGDFLCVNCELCIQIEI